MEKLDGALQFIGFMLVCITGLTAMIYYVIGNKVKENERITASITWAFLVAVTLAVGRMMLHGI